MSVILCGLPASGKTTIGKKLAEKLGHHFIDTDQLIEKAYLEMKGQNLSCRQISMQEGIQHFRALEKFQISRLALTSQNVISLGGGTLCDEENVETIRKLGCVIYLKVSVDILWKRLQSRAIPTFLDPLAPEQSFHQLVLERTPLYEKASVMTIETAELGEEDIVETILRKVNGR